MEKVIRRTYARSQWSVPTAGVLNNIPIHSLPENALHDSLNMILFGNNFRIRPGVTPYVTGGASARITGAAVFPTGFVLGTLQHISFINFSIQSIAPLIALSPTNADSPSRFTAIMIGTPPVVNVLHTNGLATPKFVAGTISAGNPFVDITGSPPIWSDFTVINNRVIGIVPPYVVQWGEPLGITTWSSTNTRVLADTWDEAVAIANFGTDAGFVYKRNSIWSVEITGSDQSSLAFKFTLRKTVEGPAGPMAVVNHGNDHYYMTSMGRIARWNGYEHEWIGDGIWPSILAELGEFTNRIHGIYKPLDEQIWFFYPRAADSGDCTGVAIICLPRPMDGIDRHLVFRGRLPTNLSMTASTNTELAPLIALDMVTFGSDQVSYKVQELGSININQGDMEGGGSAINTPIVGNFSTGLSPVPGPGPERIDSIETFGKVEVSGAGFVKVAPVSSNTLDTEDGTVGTLVDVPAATKPFNLSETDTSGRFLGLRYEFSTPANFRWRGSIATIIDRG